MTAPPDASSTPPLDPDSPRGREVADLLERELAEHRLEMAAAERTATRPA